MYESSTVLQWFYFPFVCFSRILDENESESPISPESRSASVVSFSSDKSEKSVSSARRRTSSTDTVSTDGGNKPKSTKNKAKKKEKKKKWSRSFFLTHKCKFMSFVKLRIPQWLKHFKYSRSCMLRRYSWVYKARNTLALTMRLTHPFLLM